MGRARVRLSRISFLRVADLQRRKPSQKYPSLSYCRTRSRLIKTSSADSASWHAVSFNNLRKLYQPKSVRKLLSPPAELVIVAPYIIISFSIRYIPPVSRAQLSKRVVCRAINSREFALLRVTSARNLLCSRGRIVDMSIDTEQRPRLNLIKHNDNCGHIRGAVYTVDSNPSHTEKPIRLNGFDRIKQNDYLDTDIF